MFKRIVVVLLAGLSAWLYQATVPPPPKICGTPGGPPVTSPRIRVSDGRHLAYRETGVPKQDAKYKIIIVHGFGVCKDFEPPFPQDKAKQQGVFESLHRDLMVGFGTWEFDPMELNNPFPHNESSVHIWQGYEDRIIPVLLQRYVTERLPWVQYHEFPDGGHMIYLDTRICEDILRTLLLRESSLFV
ncbi:PREDICTED: uncharacterized protein LOC104607688 [Nelumbo nucifera]|uniref:Uncharacterized protein LOC104607688 n=1 Tax=Nelumbo nucifera TaxID=4432 RepID=A0A1U8AUC9_NELNU|nr:PREDICTED: uncharacterized protein LOC104607688 [Nelumbo nucifera]